MEEAHPAHANWSHADDALQAVIGQHQLAGHLHRIKLTSVHGVEWRGCTAIQLRAAIRGEAHAVCFMSFDGLKRAAKDLQAVPG